jgi:hypothetical protein
MGHSLTVAADPIAMARDHAVWHRSCNVISVRTPLFGSLILIGTALLSSGLTSCSRHAERRDDSAARQAGRDAARATQDLKHDANEAARELRNAGNQFREGWNQGKRENHNNEDKPNPDR